MPVCTGTDRLAGLIPPFIHSFLKMPYPETDGLRYFFAPRPGMRRAAHTKGDSRTAVPWGHCGGNGPDPCRSPIKRPYARRSHWSAPLCTLPPCRKSLKALRRTAASRQALPKATQKKGVSPFPGAYGGEWARPLPKPCNKACAHRVAGLLPCVLSRFLRKKGQPYSCPLDVSVLGKIRAPCSGSPSDGGSGGLQTALPVYFPPASCRPPGRSHGWQPPGQSPSHG